MKKFVKYMSALLAMLMLLGSFAALFTTTAGAASTTTEDEEEKKTAETINYVKEVFENPDDALEYMVPYMENDNFIMYFNEYTGAFAIKNKKTEQIQFSNPYDIASSKGSEKTKSEVLSQIFIKYSDNSTGQKAELNSYTDAALNNQITVKKIKGGVRVEYIIGNEATRKLVPRLISKTNFEKLLLSPLEAAIGATEHNYKRFLSFYDEQDLSKAQSEKERKAMIARYPIVTKMVVYNLDTTASTVDINFLEEMIKGYCPDYTFDQMDADHAETGYEAENELSPVFKLALEYSLNEDGFTVREPNNGLRYNTTLYNVEDIEILPWMGAGNSYNEGYTFYPDGSGALFRFEDLNGKTPFNASRKIYGNDFAYHTISGKYQKALRMPVYGIMSNDTYFVYTTKKTVKDSTTNEETEVVTEHRVSITVKHDIEALEEELEQMRLNQEITSYSEITVETQSNGFFAVIEEGESLCSLTTYHAGSLSDYHTVKTSINPRPKDSYNLGDSISVSGSQTQTVVSDRKYTGNLKIRYILLSDEELAQTSGYAESDTYYEASYLGMANAYSDYLVGKEILTRLTEDDVTEDIPLYIESFGMIEVTEQIMSFPVTVDKPLTTFEDIGVMYDELSTQGVKNINFKLTGFANGGMYSVVPTKIKWEKAVGGKTDMLTLLEKAEGVNAGDGNLGIYPEFELSYVLGTSLFDGLRYKRDIIRTIDNRYASQREYSATYQTWVSYYNLALSPAYIDRFYNKLLAAYDEYAEYSTSLGISVSTLGSDLNTDFDEDEPYNREDNKSFIKDALAAISSKETLAGVMSSGGNAYTYKYLDHMLDVALDSSRFMKASNSVPFVGMVLHGYIQFAGDPINMEGDINYAMLKAIENGASLYFILSYRNTNYLKEFYDLSQYYSVNYAIWKEDVIKYYNELNSVMKDVQTSLIINHEFLVGTRVLDVSEIETAIRDELLYNDEYEEAYDEITRLENIAEIAAARAAAKYAVQTMEEALETLEANVAEIRRANLQLDNLVKKCTTTLASYEEALMSAFATEEQKAYRLQQYNAAKAAAAKGAANGIQLALDCQALYEEVADLLETAYTAIDLLEKDDAAQALIDDARQCAEDAEMYLQDIQAMVEEGRSYVEVMYTKVESHITREQIDERLNITDKEEEEEEEEVEEEDSIYVSDNGNIVAVTYGGKNGNDNEAYKTFILNYNNYAVTVKYTVGDTVVTYTIPANRYVVILH